MTRIIAGRAGGRALLTPAGSATRPTSDRVREAMFSSLESLVELPGAVVLDLYAGSGALGLETASRGASAVTCVEQDRGAARLITRNARTLALPAVSVACARVETWLRRPPRAPGFDLVLADPPYHLGEREVGMVLSLLPAHLAPGALVVVERSSRSPDPAWPPGWKAGKSKRYGQTCLHRAWPADRVCT
ncbi:MAG TPA: 16S rRNA (guanine(966)-N(2))-methyltransferase RsmD [Ornithinimicrobium sp.]|uniref:16S rRNA (guanine(966)-N(2))-methyltransferase RsmD n=1 Tax=Ornithinimicrobium sp. TaxID=1977084 RepID=UPI002B47E198|nr:16S rRNA (guanine(966)-N(2))-methyltransferase RsmD [Ornithinimicrobium sp.]HKJ10904.1 16S rRNA (guanine(966)-N(2))-methyltransferase RsmD [Ornithinimicrobium sp.]